MERDWMDETVPARKLHIYGDETDCGDTAPAPIGNFVLDVMARVSIVQSMSASTDSVIEDMLGAALLIQADRFDLDLHLCLDGDMSRPEFSLVPQFRWEMYRSDWAIVRRDSGFILLIECDGKDFHCSAEQIAHDRWKDAAAAKRGWRTVRFTGSEINRDPDECARLILGGVQR